MGNDKEINGLILRSRAQALDVLRSEIVTNKSDENSSGLLVLKVMSLRDINTLFGYEAGDNFLYKFGIYIKGLLLAEDKVIRIGDNEFVIILKTVSNSNHMLLAINKILQNVARPFKIEKEQVYVKVAIGAAIYPEHADDAEKLLMCSDTALGKAVEENKSYAFYAKQDTYKGYSNLIISKELDSAIDNCELTLLYQPKVDLLKQRVCGAECLMRWTNHKIGFVPPDIFIPIAESSGRILDLTLWSLNAAFKQADNLHSRWPNFQIAVNLSAAVLHDPEIIELIKRAISIWSIDPHKIILEVTESAMMTDPERSFEILQNLSSIGFHLSIDDFGTGHSSLAYLKRLPVDELKIDKSFVLEMATDIDDMTIVRSIIELAHNFKLHVTAEGIENTQTLDLLGSMGCETAQGFHIARPMPYKELEEFIQSSDWCLLSEDEDHKRGGQIMSAV
jgi:diguanylate cyclase (GGDEF)-like protein